jgi:SAM-dependent methyltransferase
LDPIEDILVNRIQEISGGVDVAGFEDRLICGTINLFDGWAANDNQDNPVTTIRFSVDSNELGILPIQKDRPDLEKYYKRKKLGFSGVIHIPSDCVGKVLIIEAVANIGSKKIGEYLLFERLSEEELSYRKTFNLPGDILQNLVVQNINPKKFIEMGKAGVTLITQVLKEHNIPLESLINVLDFGVGCGRVIRWWRDWSNKNQFWGTDINPELIEWCQKNLDFGKYGVNFLQPPTEYKNAQFDLIYVFSVFTHLTIDTQRNWLDEFSRILAPNKYLLVSVHGDLLAKYLPENALQVYRKYGYYIMTQDFEGQNLCASYQNQLFSERLFSNHFYILAYLPGALTACGMQDLFLLQKKRL